MKQNQQETNMAVLFPAGYQLALGTLDLWANGQPVLPPISTNVSALDVWSAETTIDYGTNTMGNRIKVLKNQSFILEGEVIV